MTKYFIFSDVHSYYDELMEALNNNGFDINDPSHYIISLGDGFDRGPKSKECLQFYNQMYAAGRAILILGNHEDLMIEAMHRHYFKSHDIHNGTDQTVYDLTQLDPSKYDDLDQLEALENNPEWQKYINACVDYAEISNNIFVHGWIPISLQPADDPEFRDLPDYYRPTKEVYNPNWRNPIWGQDWVDARWLNGALMWKNGIREPGKTIWCGHWHCSWANAYLHDDGVEFLENDETYYIDPETNKQEPHVNWEPFEDDGIVCMDRCTALTGKVNCKVLEVED